MASEMMEGVINTLMNAFAEMGSTSYPPKICGKILEICKKILLVLAGGGEGWSEAWKNWFI